jgi:SAM-dependent methyltransferase
MHSSGLLNGRMFFETYVAPMNSPIVVDIGAQNINGSLKDVCSDGADYVGVDFVAGNGVDIVLEDPYVLPFIDGSVDVVVSSSCFEHCEMFWILFLEIARVLTPKGLFYLNVPSNGWYHRYPVDCWRFYPDSGLALAKWGIRNGYKIALLESYISGQDNGGWNDFVCVMLKDAAHITNYPSRILHKFSDYRNGTMSGQSEILNFKFMSEDHERFRQALEASSKQA